MPSKRLDEYFKQASIDKLKEVTKQISTQQKYRITGFYKETRFQETPVGKIPKEWQIAKIKDVFDFQRGFSYRKEDISEVPSSIRFITIDDIEKEGGRKKDANPIYLKEELRIDNRFLLNEGDLLIANTDMSKGFIIGAPLYIDNELTKQGRLLIYSMDLTKLIQKKHVNTKFFFYLLSWSYIRKIMRSYAQGTNVLHLNHELVKNLYIPLPPLEEQWGIAEVLSSVDQAIEATERLIEKLEKVKRGLMQELLTKGIGHKEFKETPIGKIPKEWQIVTFKEVAGINEKPSGSENVTELVARIPMELVPEEGIYAKYELVDFKKVKSYVRVKAGDILLAKITPSFENGKQGIVPDDVPGGIAFATTEVYAITPLRIDRMFLFYLLKWEKYRKILEHKMTGTTGRKRVPREVLENLQIPLPPYEEQKRIASLLKSLDELIEIEKERKLRLERLKRGLMELLLTGRVRVRVESDSSG